MSGVNKVILVGRLGKDPEVRNLENGTTVANFTVATSESYKDKTTGEKKEITEWHNIVLWRGSGGGCSKIPSQRRHGLHRRKTSNPVLGKRRCYPLHNRSRRRQHDYAFHEGWRRK